MGIRYYKPVTAGRRGGSVSDFAEITDRKKKPEKTLLRPKPKKGGRNHQGVVCTRFRGGGHKRQYRVIDFKRRKDNVWATVQAIEYDPNRTARIALLHYGTARRPTSSHRKGSRPANASCPATRRSRASATACRCVRFRSA